MCVYVPARARVICMRVCACLCECVRVYVCVVGRGDRDGGGRDSGGSIGARSQGTSDRDKREKLLRYFAWQRVHS